MTIKQLHERLRLLEPEEKISITAGEVRALLNYSIALAITEYSEKVSKHLSEQHKRAENCRYVHVARGIVGDERFLYHSDYGMAKEYGEWPCTMELDE